MPAPANIAAAAPLAVADRSGRQRKVKTWFDFHVVFGLAGPVLSLFHTDLNIFSPVDRPLVFTLWWCVTGIVLSGIVGRFLYTAIPRMEASAEREKKKLDENIQLVVLQRSFDVVMQMLQADARAREQLIREVSS